MKTQNPAGPNLRLLVTTNRRFLPLCTGFVEQAARIGGLGDREALALTLAAEELFGYLADVDARDRTLEIECLARAYQVTMVFRLPGDALDLRFFNLTSSVALDDQPAAELGLLIASRMADHLTLSRKGQDLQVVLSKDKAYPPADAEPGPVFQAAPATVARTPDAAELLLLLRGLRTLPPGALPAEFAWPGKLLDMVAAGVYQAVVALDPAGRIGGGLLWQWHGERVVECHGPFLFAQPPATARLLLNQLLGLLAKSSAIGLLSRYPAPDLPPDLALEYFERVGSLWQQGPDGSRAEIPAYYRSLVEDQGALAWSHPLLLDYLAGAYRRLALARQLVPVSGAGEAVAPSSVLTAELNRSAATAVLHPLWWGSDAESNLREHVRVLRRDGFRDLTFELDLGRSWQAHFMPALLAVGFTPREVLPHAARGDLLVFQQEDEAAP